MNRWVELIENNCYCVPEETECECDIYRLSNSLAGELSSGQNKALDSLIEKAIEHACEMAEDGFRQGVRAGIGLMAALTLEDKWQTG